MGIEKGVTEIPDSEDEPMTSSPVENTNLAQKSRGNEIGATQASRPELHKGHLKVPSEFDDSTTSKQNRNSNQAQVDDSLKGVGPSEKDHLANPQSSDHVLQAHIDLRSTAPSEEQPHEFESATNLSHPSKEQAQAGDISPSPTQQTRILSEGTEAKASDSLEQSAASGLVLFDTRETSASKELDGECDEHQRGGTEHDAAIAEEIKHETTIEVQGGDGQDVSQQQDIPQHELSRVEKGTTTQPLEDDGLCCASKSTMLPPASRVETAGMTEQVPLHSSCTSTSSQLEGSATLENPDANFSVCHQYSDTKNSESHMEPETHGDRLQIVANHNNQEQVIEQQTTSNSDVPMPTAKITPGEHTGAENKSSSPLHILGTLDIDQHQSYTDSTSFTCSFF
ncbi:hypothetical protein BDV96DRAFT_607059 [Lophiotrema nucula]|uniref:Uncharacterized protein n=1 Tax=Lophiotrema nucula TaxID=690887 RepID=A0A6A5YKQ7_9PLEO|nr:hypothetical protein BDV96DRAFT_607059 [Lophiotrema nucula]